MLSTEPMQKVRVIGLDRDKERVITTLHRLGVLDMRKSKLELSDDTTMPSFNSFSETLIKFNGALQILGEKEKKQKGKKAKKEKRQLLPTLEPLRHASEEELSKQLVDISYVDNVYALSNERRAIREDEEALNYAEMIATAFDGINIDFGSLKSEVLAFRAFEVKGKDTKMLISELKKHKHISVITRKLAKGKTLVFVAHKRKQGIEEATKAVKLIELDLGAKYLDKTPKEVLKHVAAKRGADEKRLHEIQTTLKNARQRYYNRMLSIKEMLEIEVNRANVSTMFKRTDRAFVVEGWVPKKRLHEMESKLAHDTKGTVLVEKLEADELAPTQVNRPGILKPFDYLVEFLSVPRSDEIDPTWIFIISFPIFYGLMVSDVGYGLISFLFTTWVARITDPDGLVHNTAKIWQLMSVAAIFFGVISNQYLGFQLNQYFLPQLTLFDWLKDTTSIIGISVLFGLVQVMLGLAFGFINNWKKGHKKIAVSKITSIVTMLFGVIAVAGGFFNLFPSYLVYPSTGIAVAALIATAVLSGQEASEITNLITHPLSYARIMGFGLGSVIIAFLIDTAFTPNLSAGILVFIVYLIIFIALHFLNMILGIFEGVIQGVRLNFVEFFSKFYTGGGVKYRPFAYKRRYTKE